MQPIQVCGKRPITPPVTWLTSTSNFGLFHRIRSIDDDNTVGYDNAATIDDIVGETSQPIKTQPMTTHPTAPPKPT